MNIHKQKLIEKLHNSKCAKCFKAVDYIISTHDAQQATETLNNAMPMATQYLLCSTTGMHRP